MICRPAAIPFLLAIATATLGAQAPVHPASEQEARAILAELININTTTGNGGTAKSAAAMVARFKAAGYPAADIHVLPMSPAYVNLVVRLRGKATGKKPVMLMAHMDVVAARREDWSFDPFVFREQDGWYYGRGSEDDKAGVATIVADMVRWKREGWVPNRDIIAVLTSDEETNGATIRWLLTKHRDLIDAEYALNADGGGGALQNGKPVAFTVQASEKVYQDFRLEVTNPGGHSSVPRADNAIYQLSEGLARLSKFTFPLRLNEVSRAFFRQTAATLDGQLASDMRAVSATPPDNDAVARLSATNPYFNSVMRTTCVATRLEGGHADNALPQKAAALVNCRMAPDDPADSVEATLRRVVADNNIKISRTRESTPSPPSPLRADLMGPIERLTQKMWPGAVVVPEMSTGATDGLYVRNAGIPTYGVAAVFGELNEQSRAHGRDERVGVKPFHDAVEFWYQLVKAVATDAKPVP